MINNNAFEIDPTPRNKRRRSLQCHNVFMNPALDLLITDDAICNTTMEVVPRKRKRRSRSCSDTRAFENPALDLGMNKKVIYDLLKQELGNVNEKLYTISDEEGPSPDISMQASINAEQTIHAKQISTPVAHADFPLRRTVSFDLSFIEKIDVGSHHNEELYLDDDLNESNIMEIKTLASIKIQTEIKPKNTNPFLDMSYNTNDDEPLPHNNFPFDLPSTNTEIPDIVNQPEHSTESLYDATSDVSDVQALSMESDGVLMPRKLFPDHVNDSEILPVQFAEPRQNPPHHLNKQSKILGCDVTMLTENNSPSFNNQKIKRPNIFKHKSKKSNILHKIKDVFKHDKKQNKYVYTDNPYEVVRPIKIESKPLACFENPALNLNTDSRPNFATNHNRFELINKFNRIDDKENYSQYTFDNGIDLSGILHQSGSRKQVRFDSTLNCEKVITGSSFDSGNASGTSPNVHSAQSFDEIDDKIDEYHNELENCFNERRMITRHIE